MPRWRGVVFWGGVGEAYVKSVCIVKSRDGGWAGMYIDGMRVAEGRDISVREFMDILDEWWVPLSFTFEQREATHDEQGRLIEVGTLPDTL